MRLTPGHRLFCYTDGVTEALDEGDAEWGNDAMLAALNAHRHETCAEIAKAVRSGIAAHAGNAPQSDDITILAAEYLSGGESVESEE